MNTTAQIQWLNEAANAGTLLTKDGKLLHFDNTSTTLAVGDIVTVRCIYDPNTPERVSAVIISKP